MPYEEEDFSNAQELVKQRQRFFRKPRRPADLLGQLMARQGYGQITSQDRLTTAWQQVVGEVYGPKTRVTNLRAGVLEVLVASSTINQQLMFQKRSLLKQLKQQLQDDQIKDIRFRIGQID